MKRKLISILLASAIAVGALSGCSQSSPTPQTNSAPTPAPSQIAETAPDLLTSIREKGEIVVAMEGTWAPWTYHDESDALVGYDVEVAQKLAEKLGVTATFVEGEWDGLLAGLDAGRYDIMVNGVGVTEDRAAKYDFTGPYAYDRTAVIVSGDNNEIQSFDDLNGKQTANTISSTYATLAEEFGATVTGVDDLNQTFELLLSGRIDATLNAEVTYYDYMKAHPDANIKIALLAEDATPIAIPVRKSEETATLREEINAALAELHESGELSELSEKYFGSDISSLTEEPADVSASSGQGAPDAELSNQSAPDTTSSATAAPEQALADASSAAASTVSARTAQPKPSQTMQIRVSGNDQTVVFQLNDSSAAKALYAQLPLSTTVENYGSNEKIFYPPEKLDTGDTPLMGNSESGTLGYYAPWGDVVLFYDSVGSASGLYDLGDAVSGAEQIENLSGTIQIDVHTA